MKISPQRAGLKAIGSMGIVVSLTASILLLTAFQAKPEQASLPHAMIDGTGEGWRQLGEADFINVNCHDDTWDWSADGVKCSGQPVGVTRSIKPYTNFELVCEWRHMRHAGNSGIFLWSPIESMNRLEGPGLPEGIEVQVLDLGYKDAYEQGGRKADWFTCHGDVFPVGGSTMKPFPPAAPNGRRSFPSENRSKGIEQWNHYYIRAINGEVRLWVNGKEVSGGKECQPATGYLALESEGSPVEFRNIRIRELP
ncbi:MAG: DUF1080 domain-containing protein [Phycisphaerales bacterium]|nr:DUF1080 domain-containing protein [Phycisphaerales bacterium]